MTGQRIPEYNLGGWQDGFRSETFKEGQVTFLMKNHKVGRKSTKVRHAGWVGDQQRKTCKVGKGIQELNSQDRVSL